MSAVLLMMRTGLNRRLRDPSPATKQTAAAIRYRRKAAGSNRVV